MRRAPGVERAPGARVGRRVVLAAARGGRIVLGPSAVVGDRCVLTAAAGAILRVDGQLEEGCRLVAHDAVSVEAGARLGAECALLDADPVSEDPERPVREQGLRTAPVVVAAGALLGPRVAVLAGVTIGAGATVLAGSTCTRSVPAGVTVSGTPARAPERQE